MCVCGLCLCVHTNGMAAIVHIRLLGDSSQVPMTEHRLSGSLANDFKADSFVSGMFLKDGIRNLDLMIYVIWAHGLTFW